MCSGMTENALRKRLSRRGYKLTKYRDAYGVEAFLIADSQNVIVCGSELAPLTLEDVRDFVAEI